MHTSLIDKLNEVKEQPQRAARVDLSLLALHRDAILSAYAKSGLDNTFLVLKAFIPHLSKKSLSNWIYRNKQHNTNQNQKKSQSSLAMEVTSSPSITTPSTVVEKNKINTTAAIPSFGGENFNQYHKSS